MLEQKKWRERKGERAIDVGLRDRNIYIYKWLDNNNNIKMKVKIQFLIVLIAMLGVLESRTRRRHSNI